MITELRTQNFKPWKDTGALQFAPLTGFFGANSSGKTSILQVLLMLKQTTERPSDWNEPLYFGDEKSLVNLGSFNDVIHEHGENLRLNISVLWKSIEGVYIKSHDLKLPLNASMQTLAMSGGYPDEPRTLSFSTNIADSTVNNFHYETGQNRFSVNGTETDNLFRCYGLTESQDFPRFEKAFEDLFSRICYLGPRREDPRRNYKWEESHPNDVGHYGEKMVSALLSSRVRLRSTDEQIMKWLLRLELIHSYDVNPTSNTEQDYQLLVQQFKDGPKVGLTDVGFGVSQVLPFLALCYYANEDSILILEQPEAHLHPKVQSDLADVLIDVVKNRNIQIILESHSEHLLHRLTRRIAEEEISQNDMALYFCEINNGKSTAEKLAVDEYGNISNWPPNFFGDEMGDLAAKARAEIQRKKEINQ